MTTYLRVFTETPELYANYVNKPLQWLPVLCPIRVQLMIDHGIYNSRSIQTTANQGVWYQSDHGIEPVFELKRLENTSGADRIFIGSLGQFQIRLDR
jgi:hypothetical protein